MEADIQQDLGISFQPPEIRGGGFRFSEKKLGAFPTGLAWKEARIKGSFRFFLPVTDPQKALATIENFIRRAFPDLQTEGKNREKIYRRREIEAVLFVWKNYLFFYLGKLFSQELELVSSPKYLKDYEDYEGWR